MSATVTPLPIGLLTSDQAVRALEQLLQALEAGALPLAVRPEVAAQMLDISTKTLDKLPIKSVWLGRRTRRYPVRELIAFLERMAK